jgi:hypothetical protein
MLTFIIGREMSQHCEKISEQRAMVIEKEIQKGEFW